MRVYLKYFCYGWIILLVAILVNLLVKFFGGITWYDFLLNQEPLSIISFMFLFLIYPGIFGLIIYLVKK